MPTTHHICRLAAVEDIRRTTPLWAPDRPLFDADVWARMPALLSELLQSELVKLAIIESVPARQPRLLGAVSFIEPEYVAEALVSGSTLPNTVMRAAPDGRHPFLSPEKIAQINARAERNAPDLHVVKQLAGVDGEKDVPHVTPNRPLRR